MNTRWPLCGQRLSANKMFVSNINQRLIRSPLLQSDSRCQFPWNRLTSVLLEKFLTRCETAWWRGWTAVRIGRRVWIYIIDAWRRVIFEVLLLYLVINVGIFFSKKKIIGSFFNVLIANFINIFEKYFWIFKIVQKYDEVIYMGRIYQNKERKRNY